MIQCISSYHIIGGLSASWVLNYFFKSKQKRRRDKMLVPYSHIHISDRNSTQTKLDQHILTFHLYPLLHSHNVNKLQTHQS